MKVIFLDIDGVLNSNEYFERTKDNKLSRIELDIKCLKILKEVIDETKAYIVVTSSWRLLKGFENTKKYLKEFGIDIHDVTKSIYGNRGEEIREYLNNHNIDKFVILDDEIFPDFNELKNYLVETSFYNGGLKEEHKNMLIKKLR